MAAKKTSPKKAPAKSSAAERAKAKRRHKRATRPVGRPEIVPTGKRLAAAVRIARKGGTRKLQAQAAGVSPGLYQEWIRKARDARVAIEENPGLKVGEEDSRLLIFLEQIEGASLARAEEALRWWQAGQIEDWRAAMSYLERVERADYGVKHEVNAKVEITSPLDALREKAAAGAVASPAAVPGLAAALEEADQEGGENQP